MRERGCVRECVRVSEWVHVCAFVASLICVCVCKKASSVNVRMRRRVEVFARACRSTCNSNSSLETPSAPRCGESLSGETPFVECSELPALEASIISACHCMSFDLVTPIGRRVDELVIWPAHYLHMLQYPIARIKYIPAAERHAGPSERSSVGAECHF